MALNLIKDRPIPGNPPTNPAPRASGLMGTLLTAAALSALVGLTARGHIATGAGELPATWLPWIRAAGGLTVAVAIWRLRILHRIIGPRVRGPGRSVSVGTALITAALLMVSLASVALLTEPGREEATLPELGPPNPEFAGPDGSAQGESLTFSGGAAGMVEADPVEAEQLPVPEADPDQEMRGPEVLNRALMILILAAMALVIARNWGRRRVVDEPDLSVEEAERGLEDSLGVARFDSGDPRAQITLAYLKLQEVLTRARAFRMPQEAPHDHLYRVLGPLGISPGPLHRLAALHVLAQFSQQAIGAEHQEQASDALSESLEELRAVRGAVPAEVEAEVRVGVGEGPNP